MASNSIRFICPLILSLWGISCHDNGVDVPIFGIGIIVPGQSIDGVQLGDLRETVEAKLGEPDAKGEAYGLYRSWLHYTYLAGPHAGLSVQFFEVDNTYGPVDALAIISPYSGKTKEGIGIGSSIESVHETFGKPRCTFEETAQKWRADFFCVGRKKLEVHFVDGVVSTISIGYFVPLERDSLSQCE